MARARQRRPKPPFLRALRPKSRESPSRRWRDPNWHFQEADPPSALLCLRRGRSPRRARLEGRQVSHASPLSVESSRSGRQPAGRWVVGQFGIAVSASPSRMSVEGAVPEHHQCDHIEQGFRVAFPGPFHTPMWLSTAGGSPSSIASSSRTERHSGCVSTAATRSQSISSGGSLWWS